MCSRSTGPAVDRRSELLERLAALGVQRDDRPVGARDLLDRALEMHDGHRKTRVVPAVAHELAARDLGGAGRKSECNQGRGEQRDFKHLGNPLNPLT